MNALTIRDAEAKDASALQGLFKSADVPCFCQYWQFEGDHRDWQNRCANAREENAAALEQQLAEQSLVGFVAFVGERLVGWARLESPAKMRKLYEGRLYRGLPCFSEERSKVRAVACFLVEPESRRQGVASRLLEHLLNKARASGVSHVEAFPRGATDVTDEEQWMGPLSMYESAGFQTVREFGPYPVLRLELS